MTFRRGNLVKVIRDIYKYEYSYDENTKISSCTEYLFCSEGSIGFIVATPKSNGGYRRINSVLINGKRDPEDIESKDLVLL